MITPRDISILTAVARYYTLTRVQIQGLCFADSPNRDGRIVRKRLQALCAARLLNKTHMQVVNPTMGVPAPVYFPSRQGCEFLACTLGDERFLSVCAQTPTWQNLHHWTQVAEFHIRLDQALERHPLARSDGWLSEWDIANPDESVPEKRFRLYTLIRAQPRLVCNPDAGFLLSCHGTSEGAGEFKKVYYVELDRGTTGIQQIAASKTPGYAAMAPGRLQRRHFPDTNVDSFAVLHVTTSAKRRDLLRKAFATKTGADSWKFVCWDDLVPETLCSAPIFFACTGDGMPLIRAPQGGGS